MLKIIDVFSVIYKGRQKIGFNVEKFAKELYLTPSNIKQNTGIDICEVELLVGSYLIPEFYQKGEIMFNKGICTCENTVMKNFRFALQAPIKELKKINCHRLLNFKTIKKVFSYTRDAKIFVGFETDDEKPTFISSERLSAYTNIDPLKFEILHGSFICPVYFKAGEKSERDIIIEKSDLVLKTLNLRFLDTIENISAKLESSKSKVPAGFNNWDKIELKLV